jgi:putative transposase
VEEAGNTAERPLCNRACAARTYAASGSPLRDQTPDAHPSGYYAWCKTPQSDRTRDDQRLLGRIRQSWQESAGVYGYRKVCDDMRDLGEFCGANRVARLMRAEGLRAQRGYGRLPGKHGGKPAAVAPNHLQREFSVSQPNRVWVTDITYIRMHEGCLYLAVVLDLFFRQVVGWSMQPRIDRELALNALLMAVWRRRPATEVTVHSDQGSQFASYDWQDFLKEHGLVHESARQLP